MKDNTRINGFTYICKPTLAPPCVWWSFRISHSVSRRRFPRLHDAVELRGSGTRSLAVWAPGPEARVRASALALIDCGIVGGMFHLLLPQCPFLYNGANCLYFMESS